MSKTWDFVTTEKPKQFPHQTIISIEESVEGMGLAGEQRNSSQLRFVIGPTYIGSPIIKRKLVFSLEKSPELDFKYIEAGMEKIGGKNVHLLLEKN